MTLIAADLANLYPAHLASLQQHYLDAAMLAGAAGVVIAAGALQPCFLDDSHYPFVVNPHFKAWLPITEVPDSFLLIRAGKTPCLLLNQPEDYWHQTPADPQGFWVEHWQVQSIQSTAEVRRHLGDARDLLFIGEQTQLATEWGFGAINTPAAMHLLHFERAYKSAYEIACIYRANQTAVRGHRVAETAFRQGWSEFEIAHHYLGAIKHREQQAPYGAIVALNEHCAVLHYQFYTQQRLAAAGLHSMLIDAGASFQGYAADITRTYAYRTGLFQDLVHHMDQQHLAIIDDIQTGMNYADLHAQMHRRLAQLLRDTGLVTMAVDDMLATNLTFTFLPHGLGHFLGLQTHDVAGFQQSRQGEERPAPAKYPALRLTRDIENQQVFTIEPGLYFIPILLAKLRQGPHQASVNWALVEQLLPCGGIRIEDNIAMLDGAAVNLTRLAMAEL
ncbi:MAG: Xaa-Pro dipeptidase [Pseudomonadales bacterium]|nr:Xaa-Pro dipeptidase [Pseudomonadales bacterium]MDP4764726.1 Xaa-Pro dipeptidase [Pseudomonadales bacterium]MDP4911928.1 Xaa-Pro dipeptidase [Pseudomonadales bacterium]